MTRQDSQLERTAKVAETFGDLSLVMLNDTALSHAWRINFLANFFTGPIYRKLDEKFGISRPEFVILNCLKHQPGLVARDVCQATGQPKNSISRAVSDLLKKGYVARRIDPGDKRAKQLSLTPEGCALLEQVVPIMIERQERMRQVLDGEERAEFDRLMQKIVYAMPDWVEPD